MLSRVSDDLDNGINKTDAQGLTTYNTLQTKDKFYLKVIDIRFDVKMRWIYKSKCAFPWVYEALSVYIITFKLHLDSFDFSSVIISSLST